MTEEDTFIALSRLPEPQMYVLWYNSPIDNQYIYKDTKPEEVRDDIKKFFALHGWEYTEFYKIAYGFEDQYD